ncbi:MAG TPA: hypothetical protein VMW10_13215 [Alphaproteobacteria bacterium]|nr:hypothetical protein [Alphaproteobacteria bacterium]
MDYKIEKRIFLGSSKKGKIRNIHVIAGEKMKAPHELQIVVYPDDSGYYLLYFDINGKEITDTYHETLEGGLKQAEWEFNIPPNDWSDLK